MQKEVHTVQVRDAEVGTGPLLAVRIAAIRNLLWIERIRWRFVTTTTVIFAFSTCRFLSFKKPQ
ncbi:hypothetical protein K458DRAFT_461993 [Lentithecium fluviatile CBS 122367]|uniref:Uncharacterized protein n=1 Tax=Lentithecium fluviatile CBS 122367 TaxID=1168545 RepID=A0A6G1JG78_9PLEO|nr:hypothetical protein K458DRAFT_461993 [Lentithecium fluviatile CBS 122367]